MTHYDRKFETGRKDTMTAAKIVQIAVKSGRFIVSLRYRDDWLRKRCAKLVSEGLLAGGARDGRDLVFTPTEAAKTGDVAALSERAARKAERKRARREAKITPCEPVCCECGATAERVKGDRIYPNRPDLHPKSFFLCACGAYVGCHPFTRIPLGRPAGPATRAARNAAHAAFDPLWRAKAARDSIPEGQAREAGYAWLASELGYEPGRCHIAWMTADEARRVVDLIQTRKAA